MERLLKKPANWMWLFAATILFSCDSGNVNVTFNTPEFPFFPGDPDFVTSQDFYESVDITNQTIFRLVNTNGDITVSGVVGTNAITINGTKIVGSDVSDQDATNHLDDVYANVLTSPDAVQVSTVSPVNNAIRNYAIKYKISLPQFMSVEIENFNGTIKIDNIDNEISIDNMNGKISVQDVFGDTQAKVNNGDIDVRITLRLNGTVDLETSNGVINLTVPTNTSAEFASFANRGSIVVSNLVLYNEVRTPTSVTGTLGAGQGAITVEVQGNGSIAVRGF